MSVTSSNRPAPSHELHVLVDAELDSKVKKGVERVSENLHIFANEPSLALYRLQEHVRRAAPPTVSRRQHVAQLHTQLQGACYDVEYALSAVHAMAEASATLSSIQELLKETIFNRQQIKYEQARRRKPSSSVYKRLSSHLSSLDLPDFPELPDALRETASRMESALQQARASYDSHTSSVAATNEKAADKSPVANRKASLSSQEKLPSASSSPSVALGDAPNSALLSTSAKPATPDDSMSNDSNDGKTKCISVSGKPDEKIEMTNPLQTSNDEISPTSSENCFKSGSGRSGRGEVVIGSSVNSGTKIIGSLNSNVSEQISCDEISNTMSASNREQEFGVVTLRGDEQEAPERNSDDEYDCLM